MGMGLETVLRALESAWGRRYLESLCSGRAWRARGCQDIQCLRQIDLEHMSKCIILLARKPARQKRVLGWTGVPSLGKRTLCK